MRSRVCSAKRPSPLEKRGVKLALGWGDESAGNGPRSPARNVQHRHRRRREGFGMGQGAACREDAKRSEDAVRRLAETLSEGVAFLCEGRVAWANDALA